MFKPLRESKLERSGLYAPPPVAAPDTLAGYMTARARAWRADVRDHSPHGARTLARVAAARLPETLAETPFDLGALQCDKAFASAWVNETQVVLGTKCNRVLLVDVATGKVVEVPYQSVVLGAKVVQKDDSGYVTGRGRQGGSAEAGPSALDAAALPPPAVPVVSPHDPPCVGIHTIAINPSRTRLAVGSGRPYEVVVYSLPALEPEALLTGHADLVFSAQWADDHVLLTGSRDGTVGVFSLRGLNDASTSAPVARIPGGATLPIVHPLARRAEHAGKVRDLAYDARARQLCSLGTDGAVRVWDVARMHVVAKAPLAYPAEAVCMALDDAAGVLSVGSQTHVSFLDVRTDHAGAGSSGGKGSPGKFGATGAGRALHHARSLDEGWGVRALAHNEHTVVVGGGMGKLSFYDLRAQRYLACGAAGEWGVAPGEMGEGFTGEPVVQEYLQASPPGGFDMQSRNSMLPLGICSALYSVQFNEDKTRLFTAGGPLPLGSKGLYAAIW